MLRLLVVPYLGIALCASGCGHTLGTKIRSDQVGTAYARISGYMQTSALAPGGTWTEETRGAIRHDAILDEARLVEIVGGTCVDVVVRTESARDEPLEQLRPRFTIDGEEVKGVVQNEVVSVFDYGFTGTREIVGVEGVAADKLVAISLREPQEQVFRVIERRARICAGRRAGSEVALNLEHPSWVVGAEMGGDAYELDFQWGIE